MTQSNVTRIRNIKDRVYPRVNGVIYLSCIPTDCRKSNAQESGEFYIPPFVQHEDDYVGLCLDAFHQKLLWENPPHKEYYLKLQQLTLLLKRFSDAQAHGRKQKYYKKLQVNISGSGLSFPSDVAYHPGQPLFLNVFLPLYPFAHLTLLGEVVRSEKADIGYEVKVKYKDITEKTQKVILDFVNQCEVFAQRSKK